MKSTVDIERIWYLFSVEKHTAFQIAQLVDCDVRTVYRHLAAIREMLESGICEQEAVQRRRFKCRITVAQGHDSRTILDVVATEGLTKI